MSSRRYIVKQDRLSTGQPDAVNVASIGTSLQGTTPVGGFFRRSDSRIRPETQRQNPRCVETCCAYLLEA